MSYSQDKGLLGHFVPYLNLASGDGGVMKEIDIGAASGDHGEYLCAKACAIKQLKFHVVGEAVSGTTTAPTVVFKKRPTPNSATGASTIATLIIPSGTAIGKVVYKDIEPFKMQPGDSLHISWTIGVGTPTGMGSVDVIAEESPEVPGNISDMIESA